MSSSSAADVRLIADVDEGDDDQARAGSQRGQDLARRQRFTFLGYSFGPHHPYNPSARMYLYMSASPSKKSVQRLKTKVRELLVPGNNDPWPEVRDELNRSLRGWSSYFNLGSPVAAFRSVDHYVRERVRGFLARRHMVAGAAPVGSRTMRFIGTAACCA
jgi:hypothetical protein